MKVILLCFLMFSGACQLVLADTTSDDPKTEEALRNNVIDFRDWLMKQLSQFPKADPHKTGMILRNYASLPRKNRVINANQYNQAAKSDWVKGQVLQGLSTLSQQLANTAGTALAPQSASQLQQYSTQLGQSNDPQFQQVGTLYSQEAQALQAGNTQGANQAASQVAAVPQPNVPPGYQPTQNETSLAATLNQITGSLIGAVVEAVIAIYGGPVAASLFSPAIMSIFGGGQNTGSALATAPNPATALNTGGVNVAQTGGGALMQQLGSVNVKPLQPQNSANAGAAPPAQ